VEVSWTCGFPRVPLPSHSPFELMSEKAASSAGEKYAAPIDSIASWSDAGHFVAAAAAQEKFHFVVVDLLQEDELAVVCRRRLVDCASDCSSDSASAARSADYGMATAYRSPDVLSATHLRNLLAQSVVDAQGVVDAQEQPSGQCASTARQARKRCSQGYVP